MDYYKGCPDFGGCPSNDEIAKVHDPKKFFIINMSDRGSGGSHWVLLFQNLYFDSFGCPPKLTVKPLATVWNDTQYQDFHSSACGFYCIFVADNLLAGRPPTEGLIPDDEETPERNSEQVLREYFNHQVGEGFFGEGIKSFLKTAVKVVKTINKYRPRSGAELMADAVAAIHRGPRTSASTRFQAFLDKNEGNPVTKVQLGRKPIVSAVHKALDAISLGRFSKTAKKLNYDKVYHNYLLVTLADGKTYKLEKNETVIEKPAIKSDFENELYNIPTKDKKLTVKEMITKASEGNESRFYKYRADSDNCQRFTRDVIEKNGLLPDDIKPMEIQDAKTMVGSLPGAAMIPNAVTDLAAVADRVVHGDGMRKHGNGHARLGGSLREALFQEYF